MTEQDPSPETPTAWRDAITGEVDLAAVLDELLDTIENAKSMPLSSSAIVSRDDLRELVETARASLPEELGRARRMLQDFDELHQRAVYEAAQLVNSAKAQAAHLVSRTEVSRQARSDAERTLLDADSEARRIRHEAEDYVDRKLASFEIVLDRTIRTVKAGRERLTGTPAAPVEGPATEESSEEGEFSPFDQDQ